MPQIDDKTRAQIKLADLLAEYHGPRPGEIYRHYKGGLYTIIATALGEDSLTPVVIYHSNARGTNWVRTLENFTENVGQVPRFERTRE